MTEEAVASKRSRLAEPDIASWVAQHTSAGYWPQHGWNSVYSDIHMANVQGNTRPILVRSGAEISSPRSRIEVLYSDKLDLRILYEKGEVRNNLQVHPSIIRRDFEQEQTRTDSKLSEALKDLYEARYEAREEEFPEPSNTAIANAERLLRAMYEIASQRFEVYPTPDAEIAIDVPGGYGESVLLLCESSGGVLCMVDVHGEHRRARYESTRTLPDGFVTEALRELAYAASRPR